MSMFKIWENGECFIIGGGPSILKQFNVPVELQEKVITKEIPISSLSPYFKSIHNKHVIGVNAAYLLGTWMDFIFFGDSSFFVKNKQNLFPYPTLKVTCHAVIGGSKYHGFKYLEKDKRKGQGISLQPNKVCWNGNSGGAAIDFAVKLGVKRIYLLGFDMCLGSTNNQHWHNQYNSANRKNMRKLPFRRHILGFPKIAADAKKLGVEIINVNPDSKIEDFRKVNLTEII